VPETKTLERVRKDRRQGKAASTQAGEFAREEIEHIREGKHGARSAKQAIAIGLSKARHAGVGLKPPRKGTTSEATRKNAARDYARGHGAVPRAADQRLFGALRGRPQGRPNASVSRFYEPIDTVVEAPIESAPILTLMAKGRMHS
jgi:hypothetical protein